MKFRVELCREINFCNRQEKMRPAKGLSYRDFAVFAENGRI
jgi:hypothetical protein